MSDKDDTSKLAKPTEIFDNCGVYDNTGDEQTSILRPSGHDSFKDALTFLEWYGVKLLPKFGFIIVDNMADPEKDGDWLDQNYSNLKSLLKDNNMLGEDLSETDFKREF